MNTLAKMDFCKGMIVEINFPNVGGSIQKGKRPAIIVGNDVGNEHSPILIVVPLTSSKTKSHLPTHCWITPTKENGLQTVSLVLAEQIFTLPKTAVSKEIGYVKYSDLKKINECLKISLDIKNN